MKSILKLLAFVAVIAMASAAMAADHSVNLTVDDSTNGDIGMVATSMASSASGTKVTTSLRKLAMGAFGDAENSLQQRFDSSGNLVMDDGSVVAVTQTDIIHSYFQVSAGRIELSWTNCSFNNGTGKTKCTQRQITLLDPVNGSVSKYMTAPPDVIH